MKELIKTSSLIKTHLLDFAEVMSIVASFLEKEDLEALKLTQVANEFDQQLAELDKALKQARKTGLTEEIVATDHQRDNLFIGFSSVLNGMLFFPNENIVEMAKQIKIVVERYGEHINRLAQREETSALTNLIDDLQADDNKDQVAALNLTPWVVAMKTTNEKFEELYTERTEEESKRVIAYKPLANKINTEVSNAKQLAKSRQKQ